MESIQLSAYDFVVFGIFFLFISRGAWKGFLKQVVTLLALYLGYFAASRYHDQLLPFLSDVSDNPKVVFLSAYVILFIATYLLAALLGIAMSKVIQVTVTPWFDRLLGAVLGFAKALIIVIIVHMIIGTIVAPENRMLQTCTTCPTLNDMAEVTRKIIKDEEIQEALRQQRPAIAIEMVQDYLLPDQPGEGAAEQQMTVEQKIQ